MISFCNLDKVDIMSVLYLVPKTVLVVFAKYTAVYICKPYNYLRAGIQSKNT